jgi:hypothetical protein
MELVSVKSSSKRGGSRVTNLKVVGHFARQQELYGFQCAFQSMAERCSLEKNGYCGVRNFSCNSWQHAFSVGGENVSGPMREPFYPPSFHAFSWFIKDALK